MIEGEGERNESPFRCRMECFWGEGAEWESSQVQNGMFIGGGGAELKSFQAQNGVF